MADRQADTWHDPTFIKLISCMKSNMEFCSTYSGNTLMATSALVSEAALWLRVLDWVFNIGASPCNVPGKCKKFCDLKGFLTICTQSMSNIFYPTPEPKQLNSSIIE